VTSRKILHMHFGKEGGAERFFVNLAQVFGERGMEQRFVIRPGRSFRDELAALGLVIENNYRRLSLSAPFLTRRIHRTIREWNPHVVMAWMPRASRLIPDDPNPLKIVRLGNYPRHLKHFRHADVIVANTPGIAERCRKLGWNRPLHIISNFPRRINPRPIDRSSLDTPEDAFVIAGAGRFVEIKGFDTLIRAAAKVPEAYLWLMGDGEERSRLEALTDELGMRNRTRFTGWVREAMYHVAAADVFCLPSRHEPLGNAILESWHCGVPVVSTRSEGPEWFMTNLADGLTVEIDDVAAMAEAFARLRDDPAMQQWLVANGKAKLAAQFSEERVLNRYMDLFDGYLR